MSENSSNWRDAFIANDVSGDLRSVVGGYRQTGVRSGGGEGGGGMDARVAKLEANVEHLQRDVQELRQDSREIKTDVRDIRERVAKLEIRVDHLPSKGFVVTSLVLSLAVIAALVTFQGNIQRLVGQAPSAVSSPAPATR